MKRRWRALLLVVVVLLMSAPASIVITLFLLPLWSWVEDASGVESIGHSGPAEWCYLVIFLALTGGSLLGLWRLRHHQSTGPDDSA